MAGRVRPIRGSGGKYSSWVKEEKQVGWLKTRKRVLMLNVDLHYNQRERSGRGPGRRADARESEPLGRGAGSLLNGREEELGETSRPP